MRRRVRDFDWASTPLGPIESWPLVLRSTVDTILASAFPNIVLWGPELIQIYNDAYVPIIGVKHPAALGHGNREIWPEVWNINGPVFDRVLEGETVTREDSLYPLARRDGGTEDVYLTISYSPVRTDDGTIGGALVTMFETTLRVRAKAIEAERARLGRELDVERTRLEMVFKQAPAFLAVLRAPGSHSWDARSPSRCSAERTRRRNAFSTSCTSRSPTARGTRSAWWRTDTTSPSTRWRCASWNG
jgi:hypothetical protein